VLGQVRRLPPKMIAIHRLIPNPAEEFLSIMPPEATSGSW
jgi:hypothetical protein